MEERVNIARKEKSVRKLVEYAYVEENPMVLLEIARNVNSPSAALGVVALRVIRGRHEKMGPMSTSIANALISHENTTDAVKTRLKKEIEHVSFLGYLRNSANSFTMMLRSA